LGTHLDGKLTEGVIAEDGTTAVADFSTVVEGKQPTQRQQRVETSVKKTLAPFLDLWLSKFNEFFT